MDAAQQGTSSQPLGDFRLGPTANEDFVRERNDAAVNTGLRQEIIALARFYYGPSHPEAHSFDVHFIPQLGHPRRDFHTHLVAYTTPNSFSSHRIIMCLFAESQFSSLMAMLQMLRDLYLEADVSKVHGKFVPCPSAPPVPFSIGTCFGRELAKAIREDEDLPSAGSQQGHPVV